MSQSIFEILQQVTGSIPGCAFTSIVDASTGMSLASVPGPQQTEGSPEAADAYHSDLYRLVSRALEALESQQSLRGLVQIVTKRTRNRPLHPLAAQAPIYQ